MPKLEIECKALRNRRGQLIVAVWDNAMAFASDKSSAARRVVKAKAEAETTVVDLGDLEAGDYAVAILHDENSNGKLDLSRSLQLPTEGMGFSNDPPIGLGGPGWDASVFELNVDQRLVITLKYWR